MHLTDNLYKTNNDEYQSSLIIKQIVSNIIASFPLNDSKAAEFPTWLQEFLQKLSTPNIFIQPISELYKYAPYSQAKLAKHFTKIGSNPPDFREKWAFLTEYLFKNAKNEAFMHFFLHNCLILVRSTGIEAVLGLLKAFIYKGFSHLLAKNTPNFYTLFTSI